MEYEVDFTYFITNDDTESKDKALEILDKFDVVVEWYDDGEDFCIDVRAWYETEAETEKDILDAVEKIIDGYDVPACYDFHYIKATNGSFYWQP